MSKLSKFDKGFKEGHYKGYDNGYSDGFKNGREKDVETEHEDWYVEGHEEGYKEGVIDSGDQAYNLLIDRADELVDKKNLFSYSDRCFKMLGLKGIIDKVYNEIRKQGYDDGFENGRVEGFDKGCEFSLKNDSNKKVRGLGYNDGIEDGFSDGFDKGYERRLNEEKD